MDIEQGKWNHLNFWQIKPTDLVTLGVNISFIIISLYYYNRWINFYLQLNLRIEFYANFYIQIKGIQRTVILLELNLQVVNENNYFFCEIFALLAFNSNENHKQRNK